MWIRQHAGTPSARSPRPSAKERRLRDWVTEIAHPRHFWAEASQNQAVADLIATELASLGFRVDFQGPYRNVVAVPAGCEGKPLTILGAHYDSVPNCPGADDNGSGVAVLLECARAIAEAAPRAAIGFIAFNAEEDGLLGSRDFVTDGARHLRLEIASAHILEMCGFRNHAAGSQLSPFPLVLPGLSVGTFLALIGQGASNRRARDAMRAAVVPGLHRVAVSTFAWTRRLVPDLGRSDHAPFWDAGLPAVLWTDTGNFRNPHYHQPSDTADTLDYAFMTEVCELASHVLIAEAEALRTAT